MYRAKWLSVSRNNQLFIGFLAPSNLICDFIRSPTEQWEEDELLALLTFKVFKIIFYARVVHTSLKRFFKEDR